MQKLSPNDPTKIGPYAIVGLIGQGGMGRVYLGLHSDGSFAAVKVMADLYASIPEFRERFLREAKMVQRIKPSFIAQVLGHGEEGARLWCASEYVPGLNLAEAIQASTFKGDALVNLAYCLVKALETIHEAGIVHRDLKPANIILGKNGACVVDFGIAADTTAPSLTLTGQVLGTPSYMSSEQIVGRSKPTPMWDVFAFGCVITHAASGHPPYTGSDHMQVMLAISNRDVQPDLSGVPDNLQPLVARCLQHNPRDRPTLAQILHELPKMQIATVASTKWMPTPVTTKVDAATQIADRLAKELAPTRKEPARAPVVTSKPAPKKKSKMGAMAWLAACAVVVGALGFSTTLDDKTETVTPAPSPKVSQPATVEVPPAAFTVSTLKGKGSPKVIKVAAENRQLHLTIDFNGTAEERDAAIAKSCLKLMYAEKAQAIFRPDKPNEDTPANVIEFRAALDFPGAAYYMPNCSKKYSVAGGQWLGENKVRGDGFFGGYNDTVFPVIDAYTKGDKLKVVLPLYSNHSEVEYEAICLKTADGPKRAASLVKVVNRERNYLLLTFDAPKGTIYLSCSGGNKVSYNGKGAAIP